MCCRLRSLLRLLDYVYAFWRSRWAKKQLPSFQRCGGEYQCCCEEDRSTVIRRRKRRCPGCGAYRVPCPCVPLISTLQCLQNALRSISYFQSRIYGWTTRILLVGYSSRPGLRLAIGIRCALVRIRSCPFPPVAPVSDITPKASCRPSIPFAKYELFSLLDDALNILEAYFT